jgi:hypothetical protein
VTDEAREYKTAGAFRAALEERLQARAHDEGTDLQRLRRQFGGLRHGPVVVSVATAKQCYNKSSVNEDVSGHNQWLANIPSSAQLGRAAGHPPIR